MLQIWQKYSQIKKDLNGSGNKQDIIETANYLRISECENENKSDIIHKIVCRIQNLLPDDCTICSTRYRVDNNVTPLLACAICGQGAHDQCWMQMYRALVQEPVHDITPEMLRNHLNPFKAQSLFYLCKPCEIATIPQSKSSNRKASIPRCGRSTVSVHQNQQPQMIQQKQEETKKAAKTENTATENIATENTATVSVIPKEDTQNENQSNVQDSSAQMKPVCKHYRKGKCQFGITGKGCEYGHPKICKVLMKHGNGGEKGCRLGKRCKDFHPYMCTKSLRKKEYIIIEGGFSKSRQKCQKYQF